MKIREGDSDGRKNERSSVLRFPFPAEQRIHSRAPRLFQAEGQDRYAPVVLVRRIRRTERPRKGLRRVVEAAHLFRRQTSELDDVARAAVVQRKRMYACELTNATVDEEIARLDRRGA